MEKLYNVYIGDKVHIVKAERIELGNVVTLYKEGEIIASFPLNTTIIEQDKSLDFKLAEIKRVLSKNSVLIGEIDFRYAKRIGEDIIEFLEK